tara:strand:- start:174 stop:872 length:699 start_codon:yes stop_codon:yes gene_type:complete
MAEIQFDTLSTRAKRRADMVNSSFVSEDEIKDYLNSSIAELYDFLVKSYEDYFVKTTTYTVPLTTGGTADDLPSDFYKALGVDFVSGGITSTLKAFSFTERNIYNTPYAVIDRLAKPMYKVDGSKIKMIPENVQSGTITLFYVPLAPEFTSTASGSGNKLEFVIPGFVEYVIVATAIRMLMKEESDVSALERERQQLASRIIRAISPRDASGSHAIRDVRKGRYREDFILRY